MRKRGRREIALRLAGAPFDVGAEAEEAVEDMSMVDEERGGYRSIYIMWLASQNE